MRRSSALVPLLATAFACQPPVRWAEQNGRWLVMDDVWNSDLPLPSAPLAFLRTARHVFGAACRPSITTLAAMTHVARIAARRMGELRHHPRNSGIIARHTPCKVPTA